VVLIGTARAAARAASVMGTSSPHASPSISRASVPAVMYADKRACRSSFLTVG
jgi:hypothetical protein